ncbi:MAG: hypothetical protein QOC62_6393 [Mycobacterium sp.]|nr:hypothetical protein [Mycobacterium sp.]
MLRVPGIGTMNGFCASNQARAIWAGVAFSAFAHRVRRSTNGWLALGPGSWMVNHKKALLSVVLSYLS